MCWGDDPDYSYADDVKKCILRAITRWINIIWYPFSKECDDYTKNETNYNRFKFVLYCCCFYPLFFYFAFIVFYLTLFTETTVVHINHSGGFTLLMLYVDLFYGYLLSTKQMHSAVKFFCFLYYFQLLFKIEFTGKSNPFTLTNTRRRYPEDRWEWLLLGGEDNSFFVFFSLVNIRRYLYKFFNNFIFKAVLSTRISKNFYTKCLYLKDTLRFLIWRPFFKKQGYIRTFLKNLKSKNLF